MNLSIALAQADFEFGEPEKNFQKVSQMIIDAAEKGADMVLLPELWASGYDLANCREYASAIGEGWFFRVQSAAKESGIALGCSLIEEDQGEYYNTFVFFDSSGNLLGSYRKIHLFQMLKEKDHFQAGSKLTSFDFNSVKIGLATCYDLRFPELFSAYAAAGVELMLIAAEWPEKRINHWNLLLQARAIENQCFVAAVNKVGESQGTRLGGSSAVVNPMGEYLIQGEEKEALLLASINLKEVDKIRRWMPVLQDRKPALYQKFFRVAEN
jgi:predicted amidohydrolase